MTRSITGRLAKSSFFDAKDMGEEGHGVPQLARKLLSDIAYSFYLFRYARAGGEATYSGGLEV